MTETKMRKLTVNDLVEAGACRGALDWLREGLAERFSNVDEAWVKCPEGDWMLWVLQNFPNEENRPAILAAIQYVIGNFCRDAIDPGLFTYPVDSVTKVLVGACDDLFSSYGTSILIKRFFPKVPNIPVDHFVDEED